MVTARPPRMRWYAIPDGGAPMPHERTMRGRWGWDAVCTGCGWGSHTGGGTRSSVALAVKRHLAWEHGWHRIGHGWEWWDPETPTGPSPHDAD